MSKLILTLKMLTAIMSLGIYIASFVFPGFVFADIREMGMIVYHIPLIGIVFINGYFGVFLSLEILDEIKETRS